MMVSPAPYLPFTDPLQRRVPGLQPLDPMKWIQIDSAYAPQMAYRDHLIATRPDMVALALPDAAAALSELAGLLRRHIGDLPGFTCEPGVVTRPDGLRVQFSGDIGQIGRLVQEDWLILDRPGGASEYRLIAGNLCFASGWDLRDKIGHPLTRVHDPVPGYAAQLAPRVNRIFTALRPEHPLWRLNFSAVGTPELHCPGMDLHKVDAPERFLRVERQTLRRLPQTGAIVFGVKLFVTPVTDLTAEEMAEFRAALAAFSPEMAAYKGGAAYLDGDH